MKDWLIGTYKSEDGKTRFRASVCYYSDEYIVVKKIVLIMVFE